MEANKHKWSSLAAITYGYFDGHDFARGSSFLRLLGEGETYSMNDIDHTSTGFCKICTQFQGLLSKPAEITRRRGRRSIKREQTFSSRRMHMEELRWHVEAKCVNNTHLRVKSANSLVGI